MNIIPSPKELNLGKEKSKYILNIERFYTNITNEYMIQSLQKKYEYYQRDHTKIECSFLYMGNNFEGKTFVMPDILRDKEEGYYLTVDDTGISLIAATEKGIFYGIQTLKQINIEDGLRQRVEIIDWPDHRIRGFHYELRYGIPKFERVLEIIDQLALYKYNTLIIEYEDKFPFEQYEDISSPDGFTKEQIQKIQEYTSRRYMDVIPLQQTLGHLEYILKQEQYTHLREVKDETIDSELPFSFRFTSFHKFNHIDEICPSNEGTYELVEGLCEEMVKKHPNSTYIHIGCDEAWNLLSCSSCKTHYGDDGVKQLFIEHVNRMSKKICSLGKIPIIWDDMLRTFEEQDFEQLDKNIVIMCWLYFGRDIVVARELLGKFKKYGFQILGASSAKCSEEPNPLYFDLPHFSERQENIQWWAEVGKEFEIEGMITTAWSNYTGTVAPPHPFFDTIWYSVVFGAEKYWNINSERESFEERFIENFFGMQSATGNFENDNKKMYECFNGISSQCSKNKYIAEVYKTMALLSAYRTKRMYFHNELYKLFHKGTENERNIMIKKLKEITGMRDFVKQKVRELLSIYYPERDVNEFIDSRFLIDDFLLEGRKLDF